MKHRLIPISLCHLMLRERLYNQFRSYLVLNFNSDGYIYRKEAIRLLMSELGISRNTAKNHLSKCIGKNWLGLNDGKIYVRAIDYIRIKEKATQRQSVWLNYKFIKSFKAFCFAALVTQITKDLRRLNSDQNRGRSHQKVKPSFYPIAGNYIEQKYSISQSVCSRLAFIAKQVGFIDTKDSLIPYSPDGELHTIGEIGFIKSNLPTSVSNRLKVKRGIIYIQMPIKMKSNLVTKRRKRA